MHLFRGRVPFFAALVVLVAAGLFVFTETGDNAAPPTSRLGSTLDPNDTRTAEEVRLDMLATVAEHPSYAGVYIDSVLGIVIRATDELDWFEAATADYAAHSRRVSVEPAEYTMTELEAGMADIDLMEWRDARGVPMTTVGVDVKANRVRIGVQGLEPEHEAALREAYGDLIVVVEQASFSTSPGATTGR